MSDWSAAEGSPVPLGATWIESAQAWNFALYSKHAESVTLLLYAEADLVTPVFIFPFDYLRNKSGRVWHCRLARADLHGARFYAYLLGGPAPQGGFAWHCFDPDKILLDPYAKSVFFPPAFDRAAAAHPGSNAGKAPLGLLARAGEVFDCGEDRRPRHEADTIIYELHVRGFTNNPNSDVRPDRRGTFAGLVEKIPYLKDVGVTAVELMPIFQFDPKEGNYWGYMPLSFFAPHHAYGSRPEDCDQHNAFRTMVKALHAADIEIILDVVYNHTAEGDQTGPVYSYKGIDNSTYYLMSGRPGNPYENFSGAGNTLHCANRFVRKMIVDSLRYWVKEMHVDGFRFDLASVFARNEDGSLNLKDPPIFGDILSDPDLADIRLIAEPWDAAGAYQLGRSFPATRWFQWNGRFRDDVRRFMRGDPGLVPALMQRLYGAMTCSRTTACMHSIPTRASTMSRPTTASPCTTSCPTTGNATRPTATTTRTARSKTTAGTAGGRETTEPRPRFCNCVSAKPRTSAASCSWRTARRCSAPATSSCKRRAATTTRTTRTTRPAGWTGICSTSTRMSFDSSTA